MSTRKVISIETQRHAETHTHTHTHTVDRLRYCATEAVENYDASGSFLWYMTSGVATFRARPCAELR